MHHARTPMTPSCRLVQGTSPAPSSVLGIAGQWARSFLGSRVPFAAMPLLELAPPGVLSCARCSCDFGASGGGCHCGRVWPCGYGRACGAGCGAGCGCARTPAPWSLRSLASHPPVAARTSASRSRPWPTACRHHRLAQGGVPPSVPWQARGLRQAGRLDGHAIIFTLGNNMYIKQFGQHSSRPRARLPGSEECFNALGIFHALGSDECFNAELCR